MYKIKVGIEGIAPILFNRFTEEDRDSLAANRTGGKKTTEERLAQARNKVYQNGNGLFLPSQMLKACLLKGVTLGGLKEGKRTLYPYVQATVFIEPKEISLSVDEPDFIDETPGRIPPKTGGMAIIRRPGLKEGWQASFTLIVADDRRDSHQLRIAFDEAGLLAGLGSSRPDYGRFIVKEWEVLNATK